MKSKKKIVLSALLALATVSSGFIMMGPAEASSPDRGAASSAEYQRLFGTDKIAEATNDPELAATMQRFIYVDIKEQAELPDRERELVTLVTLATLQNQKMLQQHVEAALRVGVTPLEVREAVYQVTPYIGFPRTFDALELANQVFQKNGVKLPLPSDGTVTESDRLEKGLEVQVGIYGERIRTNREKAAPDTLHVQDDLSAFCFGDTYTRKALDFKTRELLTMSVIAALGGAEPQLKGHILGNVNVGNDRKRILGAVTTMIPYIGFPRTLNALACVNEIVPYQK